jgi:hypothetical protein
MATPMELLSAIEAQVNAERTDYQRAQLACMYERIAAMIRSKIGQQRPKLAAQPVVDLAAYRRAK